MHGFLTRIRRFSSILTFLLIGGLPATIPAAAQDFVKGTFSVDGKTYELSHIDVRRQPSMTEERKMVVVVLMTDNPVPKNVLDDKYRLELADLAREGKIHGVSVTLGGDKRPRGTGWTYAKEFGGAIVNRADQQSFQGKVLDESHAIGKLSGQGTFGDQKWEYTATFEAAVSTIK